MVRIVNGEIVPDDDDKQQRHAQPSPSAPRSSGAAQRPQPPAQPAEQWWQRQPLMIRQDVPPVWGLQLPAVEIFGTLVSAQQLLIALALGLFFGWRTLLFLAIVFLVVKANASPPSAPRRAASSGTHAAANFLSEYMATNPAKPSSEPKDPWGTRGKGQKLGSA